MDLHDLPQPLNLLIRCSLITLLKYLILEDFEDSCGFGGLYDIIVVIIFSNWSSGE